jgi:hypothetical protein
MAPPKLVKSKATALNIFKKMQMLAHFYNVCHLPTDLTGFKNLLGLGTPKPTPWLNVCFTAAFL